MTKDKIIIAALRLFLLRGYKSVSLIDVAQEVGITKGGIYHYFASKDDLFQVSLHFLFDRFEAKYTNLLNEQNSVKTVLYSLIVDRTAERQIKDLLQAEGNCNLDFADFAITAMRKFPAIQQRIEHSYVNICEALAKRLEGAIKTGEIPAGFDCFALSAAILALANGQNSLGSHFQSPAIRQRILESALRMLGI